MSKQSICDKCGAVGANELTVSVTCVGVVIEGQPTATQHGVEVCPKCRRAAARELLESALAQFERDVPIHKELIRLSELETAYTTQLSKQVAERDSYKNTEPQYHEHDKEVVKLVGFLRETKQHKEKLHDSAK